MLSNPTFDNGRILIQKIEGSPGGKKIDNTTKCFTHGRITIDTIEQKLLLGSHPALSFAAGEITVNDELALVLLDEDQRTLQERRGVIKEEIPGVYVIGGVGKPKGAPARKFQSRAYFTHPGIETDSPLPDWLIHSRWRQRALWNRAAYECRKALRACSTAPVDDVRTMVETLIKPAIDEYNNSLKRDQAKLKMKYPADLTGAEPALTAVWDFIRLLGKRTYDGKPVPENLQERLVAFARQYKYDSAPMKEFERNINAFFNSCEDLLPGELARIDDRSEASERRMGSEASESIRELTEEVRQLAAVKDKLLSAPRERWVIRHWERKRVQDAFVAALKTRKAKKNPFAKGWPRIKYPDSPGFDSWGIQYYFNSAGEAMRAHADGSETVRGIVFGPPVLPEHSGRQTNLHRFRRGVRLRSATISFRDKLSGEMYVYRFAVLQHRSLPEKAVVKQWDLIHKDGKLWLSFTVSDASSHPAPNAQGPVAGLDIGWRSTEYGYRVATLYDPTTEEYRYITVDFGHCASSGNDVPFPVNMNKISAGRSDVLLPRLGRQIAMGFSRNERRQLKAGNDQPESTYDLIRNLQQQRDAAKDKLKRQIKELLGARAPAWLAKAGINALRNLTREHPDAGPLVATWESVDARLGDRQSFLSARVAARLDDQYIAAAHAICRYLRGRVSRIAVEDAFLAKMISASDVVMPESLARSQLNRQHVAPAKFVGALRNTAAKYGIAIEPQPAGGTSFRCARCEHLNAATEDILFTCGNCDAVSDQDENAALNLSRAASGQVMPQDREPLATT